MRAVVGGPIEASIPVLLDIGVSVCILSSYLFQRQTNIRTGRIVHSTPGLDTISDKLSKSGLVVCSAISEDGRYLVTVTGDKVIRVWEICEESLTLLSER